MNAASPLLGLALAAGVLLPSTLAAEPTPAATTSGASTSVADVHPDVARGLAETGAPVKVWVFLADKGLAGGEPERAALLELQADWPARSLARRAARRSLEGLVDARDLPVAPAYVEPLAALGTVVERSRWLNAVSLVVDAAALQAVAALPFVERVRLVGRSVREPADVAPADVTPAAAFAGSSFYGHAEAQAELIDVHELHALGLTGAGAVVGVLDTGFVTTHDAFQDPVHGLDVITSYDFVNDDTDVGIEPGDDPGQHHHGTYILGALAAYLPDSLVGIAYDADYILCKTEDYTQEVPGEEDFFVAGLEFAELNGADVVTSSLGYIDWYTQADLDGVTAVTTIAVNLATANGVHVLTAAGNSGNDSDPSTSSLIAPSDAFDVITCGASEFTGEPATFSSSGPTADGRAKPEVMAMGVGAATVWPDDDSSYVLLNGTSISTPQVAGVVACLAGAHPDWTVAGMRERLMDTADFFGEPKPDPLGVYGWGIVDADDAATHAGGWLALGGGVAGTAGLATLAGSGSLQGDEPVGLEIAGGPPLGPTFLVIGLSELGAPFKGGTLLPSPDIVVGPFPLGPGGDLALSFPWVPQLPSGVGTWYQCWMPDAGAPVGFAGTNGVRGLTP